MDRILKLALASLSFNVAFATYHLVMGSITGSWWLLTLGSYYLALSTVRFVVLRANSHDRFITNFTGWMLIILSVPLAGTVLLSIVQDRGYRLHMIVMIAMAAYTFTKITVATINLIKSRRSTSATLVVLRNITFADAFVSIFALQRSMLVSFEGMSEEEIVIMNGALGSTVCILVFLLGISLLRRKRFQFDTRYHE